MNKTIKSITTSITRTRLNPIYTPIILSLVVLSIYLITGSLIANRSSPPVYLTVLFGLLLTSYQLNLVNAVISIGLILFINIFLAIDHIHGECYYDVMVGRPSWAKERLGELAFYRQCVQAAQAWWIMAIVGLLWLSIFIIEALRIYQIHQKRIKLPIRDTNDEEGTESSSR